MTDVYLHRPSSGKGCNLIDSQSGELRLLTIGVPQAWIAAAGQGWTIIDADDRQVGNDRQPGETINDWGTRLLLEEQRRRSPQHDLTMGAFPDARQN